MDRKQQLRRQAAERSRQRRKAGRAPTAHPVRQSLPSNGGSGTLATFSVTSNSTTRAWRGTPTSA